MLYWVKYTNRCTCSVWWEHKGKSVSEIPDLPDEGIHHVGLGILTNMVPGGRRRTPGKALGQSPCKGAEAWKGVVSAGNEAPNRGWGGVEQWEALLPRSRAGSDLLAAEAREGFRLHTAAGSILGGGRTLTLCLEGGSSTWKAGGGESLQVTGSAWSKDCWEPLTQALWAANRMRGGGGGGGHRVCEQGLGRGETFCPASSLLGLPGRWGAHPWAVECGGWEERSVSASVRRERPGSPWDTRGRGLSGGR